VIDEETAGVPGTDDAKGASTAVSVAIGDFNGDDRADIAWGLPDLNRLSVVYGSKTGIASSGAQTFIYGKGGVQGKASTVNCGHRGAIRRSVRCRGEYRGHLFKVGGAEDPGRRHG
jgi:hypothetical protein